MTDVQQVAPVEGAERMPDLTVKLKAAVNEYKKAISLDEKTKALNNVVDIYVALIGENPTAQSMLTAKEVMDAAVVEGTDVVGDDSERPEHPNSWSNFHAKMTLYARVMEAVVLRSLNGKKTAEQAVGDEAQAVVGGVQDQIEAVKQKGEGGGHIGDTDAMDPRM